MDATAMMKNCTVCPRECGVDRTAGGRGICGAPDEMIVARAALHFWEEPCISGHAGSGAVFFSGCSLRCIFCQNANDRFDEHRAQMKTNGQEAFLEMMPFYTKDNVFYIPECARWAYIMENEIRKGCKAPICLILEMQTRDSERR